MTQSSFFALCPSSRIGNYLSAKFEYSGFIKPFAAIEKYCGKDNNGLIQTNKKWCVCAQWWC
jgi:hypothetical protein